MSPEHTGSNLHPLIEHPANAARLAQGIAQLESGDTVEVDLEKLSKELK
ncbi:hypothetical protein ABZ319_07675 [Nocardia sp. NPDC005978]